MRSEIIQLVACDNYVHVLRCLSPRAGAGLLGTPQKKTWKDQKGYPSLA